MSPLVVVIMLPLMWCGISFLLTFLSGWAKLAERYPDRTLPDCKAFYCQSGNIGGVNYNSCLTLCVSQRGLGLSVMIPFRIGHPTLWIPWSDFHDVQETRTPIVGFRSMTATLGTPPTVKVKLPAWLIDYVEVGDGYDADQDKDLETESELGPKWQCKQCGERNEPTFDVCWQCQAENDNRLV
ncbi:hypothetical protein CA13_01540 [Planctomycetes bacterium CA13]|uniref:RanBP2-type domain-containing protein n=1 Tax=Novipirellula herctigrandis TaxID=2527986 RepID=A0A5C5YW48_9BACT|nr:hypothetical protein CA13_01540 [Planctomycetes bacterium CA13]